MNAPEPAGAGREPVIAVQQLVKCYGAFRAVDGISFSVARGETVGLLGPNGAGKTSIMRVLAGLCPADGGTVQVAGLEARTQGRRIRQLMGVVTQQDGLDNELNVRQNLESFGYLCGLSRRHSARRAAEVLAFFSLAARSEAAVDDLSGGMKRRLAIARALMIEPQVIVLDEPTTGLDPHSRSQVWEKLAELKARGVTVLMSTHYMEEADELCDRIAIVAAGEIATIGTPKELKGQVGADSIEIDLLQPVTPSQQQQLERVFGRQNLEWEDQHLRVLVRNGPKLLMPALTKVHDAGLAIGSVEVRQPSLDDAFLRFTGQRLEVEA